MRSPEERAKEMINEFSVVGLQQRSEGIECAFICVKNIIKSRPSYPQGYASTISYWKEVLREIENELKQEL